MHRHGDAQLSLSLQQLLGTDQGQPDQLAVAIEANRVSLRPLVEVNRARGIADVEVEHVGAGVVLQGRECSPQILERRETDPGSCRRFCRLASWQLFETTTIRVRRSTQRKLALEAELAGKSVVEVLDAAAELLEEQRLLASMERSYREHGREVREEMAARVPYADEPLYVVADQLPEMPVARRRRAQDANRFAGIHHDRR